MQIGLQHRVRPDLDKDAETVADQPGHAVGEPDRVADVAPPIRGIEFAGRHRFAGNRRDQRRIRRGGGQAGKVGEKVVADRVHRRRMKCEIEIEGAECDAAAARFGSQPLDRVFRAGQRDRLAGIQGAQFERAAGFGEQRARRLGAQSQRRHAAAAARAFLLSAARHDDPRRVGQRQRAGRPGGADLADAVADMQPAGSIPSPRSTVTMPTCTAKSSGCAMSVCASCSASAPRSSRSPTDQPSAGRNAASARATASRNAAFAR